MACFSVCVCVTQEGLVAEGGGEDLEVLTGLENSRWRMTDRFRRGGCIMFFGFGAGKGNVEIMVTSFCVCHLSRAI